MVPVPFTLGDALDDEAAIRGRVSFGGASLTLELLVSGGDESSSRKVVIGVEEFAACRFRRGLLGDRLDLKTIALGALGGVPGARLDAMSLRFARRDREAAEALAGRLATMLPERAPARPAAELRVMHPGM